MTIHELKTWTEYFNPVNLGNKTFEWRKNDRDFKVSDFVILKEYNPETKEYTGRDCVRKITYILNGPGFDIPEGYVILSLRIVAWEESMLIRKQI